MARKNGLEFITEAVALVLTIAALVLFCLSYTTGYYTFGQMQSGIIAVLLAGALAAEAAALVVRQKLPTALWPKFFTFAVTALLAAAAILLIGDRVEGIGNCIITDYDSGHGGEESIYLSLAASGLMLIAMIYNLIGSFGRDKTGEEAPSKGKAMARDVGFGVSALAVLLAVIIPTANMVRGPGGARPAGLSGAGAGGTYTVSFNQGSGNVDNMPAYQFLCTNFKGFLQADSRFYVDVTLTLDGGGNYTLFADSYVIESGKRAEIGDDTGLGLILTMNAEGTYTENADGTVTTSTPSHAVFEMRTDTYSVQMKQAAGMAVNGNNADGVYDSADEPAVLDFVPETVWTLDKNGMIVTWAASGAEANEPPADSLTVTSDDGGTTFTFYADGTCCFSFESYGIEDKGTYTYADGLLTVVNANGDEVTADGDPLKFHYVSAVNEQLTGDYTVNAAELSNLLDSGASAADSLTVTSDDGATTFLFKPDGTYCFTFDAYGIEDNGAYTYEGGTLTITNAEGGVVTAQGDPLKFHYITTVSDQLTGDFTVPAADLRQ